MNAKILSERIWKYRAWSGNFAFIAGKGQQQFSIVYEGLRYDFRQQDNQYLLLRDGKAVGYEETDKLGNGLTIRALYQGRIFQFPLFPQNGKTTPTIIHKTWRR